LRYLCINAGFSPFKSFAGNAAPQTQALCECFIRFRMKTAKVKIFGMLGLCFLQGESKVSVLHLMLWLFSGFETGARACAPVLLCNENHQQCWYMRAVRL